MSLRLPRPVHERMKDLASERGLRVADFYTQTVEAFIREELASYKYLFAVQNDAVHITVDVLSEFARSVRQAARDRRFSPNELIYTAVCHKVDELSERAA
ncbi:MAG: hypothetical protein ACXU8X_20660 [Caulobacteraceae bacterium]